MNEYIPPEEVRSIRGIARTMGMSPTTIHKVMRETRPDPDEDGMIEHWPVLGLDGKRRPNRRFNTDARDEQIRALREEGRSVRAIAAELGCSVGTVHRVVKTRP